MRTAAATNKITDQTGKVAGSVKETAGVVNQSPALTREIPGTGEKMNEIVNMSRLRSLKA